MNLILTLIAGIFSKDASGGKTMQVVIIMTTPTECGAIERFSTSGGDKTRVEFKPPLPLDEALMKAQSYDQKGTFIHTS